MRSFIAKQNAPILLGRRGENKAEEVLIDVRDFFRDFGSEATFTMFNQLPGEASPYAVATSVEDGVLHWEVSSVDTSKEGAGKAMLFCYVGDQIAKSVIYNTLVEPTLGESVEPPPAFEPFANRIAELNGEAQEAARESIEAAGVAADYAGKAEDALQELKDGIASGDFKGEPGEPGEPGKDGRDGIDGYTPIKGVDYFDGHDGKDGANGKDGKDGHDGSDASVTAGNIRNALGFDPANAADVSSQFAEIVALTSTKVGYSEVVNGQLLMYSDSTKAHLLATLDLPSSGNVKINGVETTDNNIPIATFDNLGAVKGGNGTGTTISADGKIYSDPVQKSLIDSRIASFGYLVGDNYRTTITPSTIDYAVKAAMCDGKGAAWSDTERQAARERIGVDKEWVLIDQIILDEPVKSISRTSNSAGTPYAMLKCALLLDVPQSATLSNGYVQINGVNFTIPNLIYTASRKTQAIAEVINIGNRTLLTVNGNSDAAASTSLVAITSYNTISRIGVASVTDTPIPAGTQIYIYGII